MSLSVRSGPHPQNSENCSRFSIEQKRVPALELEIKRLVNYSTKRAVSESELSKVQLKCHSRHKGRGSGSAPVIKPVAYGPTAAGSKPNVCSDPS